jgi:hypothetical protein
MLDTCFPRPPGDIGHPASFAMPVRHRVVPGASAQRVVRGRAEGLLPDFIAAAQALVGEGAAAVTTSCGFMALHQREMEAALPVPVWTSSLLALPGLAAHRPGVITADAASLGPDHLRAVGADPATPIEGLEPASPFTRMLMGQGEELDEDEALAQVLGAARRLRAREPSIGVWLLECTNLPPYAQALRGETGLPVHDILTLIHARWAALEAAR